MSESSKNTNNSAPTKRIEIDSRLQDVTKLGTGVLIIGGVRPPRKQTEYKGENSSPSK